MKIKTVIIVLMLSTFIGSSFAGSTPASRTLVANTMMIGSTYCNGVGAAFSPNIYKFELFMPANGMCQYTPSVAQFQSSTPNTPMILNSFSFTGTFNGVANSLASQNDAFDIFATNSFNFHGKEFGFLAKITDGAFLGYIQSNDTDYNYVVLHPATADFKYTGNFVAQLTYNGIDNVNFYQNGVLLGTVSDPASSGSNYTSLRYWMYINAARYSNTWTSTNSIDYEVISKLTTFKHK